MLGCCVRKKTDIVGLVPSNIFSNGKVFLGWTVQGSNPGGKRDFLHQSKEALGLIQSPLERLPCSLSRGQSDRNPPHLEPSVKKGYS